jgi:hypothetical protein
MSVFVLSMYNLRTAEYFLMKFDVREFYRRQENELGCNEMTIRDAPHQDIRVFVCASQA